MFGFTASQLLVMYFLIAYVFGVFYRLAQVAQGEHEHEEDPVINAIVAVLNVVFAILVWLYLWPLLFR